MTIAACYLASEGVVLGADSTTTLSVGGRTRHYDFAQKVFEVGRKSTLGMTMWGLGSLPDLSFRTLVARLADQLETTPASSVEDAARRWAELFWSEYSSRYAADLDEYRTLRDKYKDLEPSDYGQLPPDAQAEVARLAELAMRSGGFCFGGVLQDHTPEAYEITYSPNNEDAPSPTALTIGGAKFWGQENIINRLLLGFDLKSLMAILSSEKWIGTAQDLIEVAREGFLSQPYDLPLREAIDWVHASIYATVKAFKFSQQLPVCGGPIEVAVISTDRPFRWVRHKRFDDAIVLLEGAGHEG